MSKGYAIAAGHAETARAGAEVLAQGGSAADAALAAALMAMVAEPVLAGLLGGGFAMLREPGGRCRLLDAFVDTPGRQRPEGELDLREVHADFGATRQAFHIGAGTVAASCLAAGLWELQARFGRMPVRDLVAPAAEAARRGVAITPFQAKLAQIVAPILTATPAARALHCDGERRLLGAGAARPNPALAEVLEELARAGPRFVSEGEVAAALAEMAASGGHLARDDMARARPVWREPVEERRGAARLALTPPPALGGTLVALTLALLGRTPGPLEIAEALAAVARARVEAELDAAPEAGALRLAAPALRDALRDGVRRRLSARGTTQISVVDGEGLGVALTLSNGEGAGMILPGMGVMPNNMLGEEDLVPGLGEGRPLAWAPGTRLASMMAPMAITWPDGRVALLGSGGSNRIRTALAQVALGLVDRGLSAEAAVAAPRLHLEGARDPALDIEVEGRPEAEIAALTAAYPEARLWETRSMFFGGAHVAVGGPRGLDAAGDPRRDGRAILG